MKWVIIFLCSIALLLFNSAFVSMEHESFMVVFLTNLFFFVIIITRFDYSFNRFIIIASGFLIACLLFFYSSKKVYLIITTKNYELYNCDGFRCLFRDLSDYSFNMFGLAGPIFVESIIALFIAWLAMFMAYCFLKKSNKWFLSSITSSSTKDSR